MLSFFSLDVLDEIWDVIESVSEGFLGWSCGAMVLGKLPMPGRPTILMLVGRGPIALAICAVRGCLDIFTLLYLFSLLFLPVSGDDPI